jgi:hypothetical protein
MAKARNKLPYVVEHDNRNVATVRLDECNAGREFWFLLRSDVHHDNPRCDQALERKHLEQAKERGAGIIDNGDLFCAMQGKFDKRSSKSEIRPEHQRGDYLDRLVNTATDFYQPFADNFVVMSHGNHETAINQRHETDLTERLVQLLNSRAGTNIQAGGYGGYVRFLFRRQKCGMSRVLKRFHGTGGGGPVTRGVIQTNRMAVMFPDADIILTGHTHDEWVVPIQRERINDAGRIYQSAQIHVRVPGYKDAWDIGEKGWEVEKMLGPKPIGSKWLKFTVRRDNVETEVLDAK